MADDDRVEDAADDAPAARQPSAEHAFASLVEARQWLKTQPPLQQSTQIRAGSAAPANWSASDPATWVAAAPEPGKRLRRDAYVTRILYSCSRRAPKTEQECTTAASLAAATDSNSSRAVLCAADEDRRRRQVGGRATAKQVRACACACAATCGRDRVRLRRVRALVRTCVFAPRAQAAPPRRATPRAASTCAPCLHRALRSSQASSASARSPRRLSCSRTTAWSSSTLASTCPNASTPQRETTPTSPS